MTPSRLCSAILAAVLLPAAVHAAPPAAAYVPGPRWTLDGAGKWDYADVDPVCARLYLTRGERVQVLDLKTGKPAGEIGATAGVHGVAFAQDLKRGYASNGRANSVIVFDLDTLKTIGEIKVAGVNPDAILYEPASHKLYTFNGKSGDVSVFDAATLKALATIKVGGKPEFAVGDGAGRLFFNDEDGAQVGVIDVATDKLAAQWKLPGCEEPSGLAIDAAKKRLFSVCANGVMAVTDAASGAHVASLPIGGHPDAAAYDAASATVFSSNGEGTLSVIRQLDADHYAPAQEAPTIKGARTMALDHASGKVYLPTLVDGVFTVLVMQPAGR
jgi:YVTN family beta-propeller protein